jgi:hypothetical protein
MEQQAGLLVPMLRNCDVLNIGAVSKVLDAMERNSIGFAPWGEGAEQPRVSFVIAHGSTAIYLKYYVEEPTIKAEHLNLNDPVYKDSCVEFFIAFNGDKNYYNLEFNCVGNCRGQYGVSKLEREFLAPELLKTIRHGTSMKGHGSQEIEWELTLCIPLSVFSYHPMLSLESCRAKGNFYKCGDDLPEPHYLCSSKITAPFPEFHLKEFFSEISFDGDGG